MIRTHRPPFLDNIVLGFIRRGQRIFDEPHLVRLYPLHVLQVSGFSVDNSEYCVGLDSTYLLDRVRHDVSDDSHIPLLANPMNAINGLGLSHRVPMGLYDMNRGCSSEINTFNQGQK